MKGRKDKARTHVPKKTLPVVLPDGQLPGNLEVDAVEHDDDQAIGHGRHVGQQSTKKKIRRYSCPKLVM